MPERRFQFSLGSLIKLTLIASVLLGLTIAIIKYRDEQTEFEFRQKKARTLTEDFIEETLEKFKSEVLKTDPSAAFWTEGEESGGTTFYLSRHLFVHDAQVKLVRKIFDLDIKSSRDGSIKIFVYEGDHSLEAAQKLRDLLLQYADTTIVVQEKDERKK